MTKWGKKEDKLKYCAKNNEDEDKSWKHVEYWKYSINCRKCPCHNKSSAMHWEDF